MEDPCGKSAEKNTPLQDIQLGGGKLYILGLDPFIGRLGISLRAGWTGASAKELIMLKGTLELKDLYVVEAEL